jgi:hypothetical protein
MEGNSLIENALIVCSLFATVIAFIGTSRALPAMKEVLKTLEDEILLTKLMNRFGNWHAFSAIWQIIAFVALVLVIII